MLYNRISEHSAFELRLKGEAYWLHMGIALVEQSTFTCAFFISPCHVIPYFVLRAISQLEGSRHAHCNSF